MIVAKKKKKNKRKNKTVLNNRHQSTTSTEGRRVGQESGIWYMELCTARTERINNRSRSSAKDK